MFHLKSSFSFHENEDKENMAISLFFGQNSRDPMGSEAYAPHTLPVS